MAGKHYEEFIEEAFIRPIRSVLIIDDDYPTYDELLNPGDESSVAKDALTKKVRPDVPKRVASLIQMFRKKQPPLLVDIHNGRNVTFDNEVTAATHLHQCDLLVLDYELDRTRPNDPTRAIDILRGLMSNNHFNLVIIYTYEELDVAYNAVLWRLIARSKKDLSSAETEEAEKLIASGEEQDEDFMRDKSNYVGARQYFDSCMNPDKYIGAMMQGKQPYTRFIELAKKVNWLSEERKLVLRYLLKILEDENLKSRDIIGGISEGRFNNLECSLGDCYWIKSDSAFVAFSQKISDDDDLLADLRKALIDWSPPPSRLFLTKLRAEVDEHGVAAQGHALRHHHAFAYWYHRLLSAKDAEHRRWQIAESISRHSDQLMQEILPEVEQFASRLITAEVGAGQSKTIICKNHFGVDFNKENDRMRAGLEHNAFVCSMEPTGWHLNTGHVFSMAGEHWLCLSPACDMVPSQIPESRTKVLGERLPFVGIRLQSIKEKKALSEVESNRLVFLQIDGKVKSYCFNDFSLERAAPYWFVLFAENKGQFSKNGFKFTVSRIKQGESEGLVSECLEAKVVGQLRYEYALNLIQKLGISLTRVGLDFSDMGDLNA